MNNTILLVLVGAAILVAIFAISALAQQHLVVLYICAALIGIFVFVHLAWLTGFVAMLIFNMLLS